MACKTPSSAVPRHFTSTPAHVCLLRLRNRKGGRADNVLTERMCPGHICMAGRVERICIRICTCISMSMCVLMDCRCTKPFSVAQVDHMRELASAPKEVDAEELEELYLTKAKSVHSST
jgi:hypothetical protein